MTNSKWNPTDPFTLINYLNLNKLQNYIFLVDME